MEDPITAESEIIDVDIEDEIRNAKAYLLTTSSKTGENLYVTRTILCSMTILIAITLPVYLYRIERTFSLLISDVVFVRIC